MLRRLRADRWARLVAFLVCAAAAAAALLLAPEHETVAETISEIFSEDLLGKSSPRDELAEQITVEDTDCYGRGPSPPPPS
jgi:hypothetical protein